MSMLNFSGDESPECPLCMELLELDDINFFPCACGYQVSDYALVLLKVLCISPLLIIDFGMTLLIDQNFLLYFTVYEKINIQTSFGDPAPFLPAHSKKGPAFKHL